jgi:hypothetical protein
MDTPSQQITKPVSITVTDSRGRNIEVRKLRALDRMRFFQIIGSENATNPGYIGIGIFAYAVTSIDGAPVPTAGSRMALEGIVSMLDDDGVNAISAGFREHFMPKDQTEAEATAELKNE